MSSINGLGGPETAPSTRRPPRRQVTILAAVTVVMFIVVPFLFWRGTWFGRRLTDQEVGQHLVNEKKPREIQHALSQIADRMARGDRTVTAWYPQIINLVNHRVPEVRVNAAWTMGQDNSSPDFHAALLRLVSDEDPMVRRNAALSLVRFGDPSGKPEILAMIRPYKVRTTVDGVLSYRLELGDAVNPGTLLVRLDVGREEPFELRSPLPGDFERKLAPEGAQLKAGDEVLELSPGQDHVWEALRALYLIGEVEDLPEIGPIANGAGDFSDRIREQARLTVEAIRKRGAPTP
ncbi:MAG: HEAT repeat domain-containing protein [Acidobacteria bacterium]|nr:HEAT repeat domain-containing protein [Acidobacteriota bacterium]